MAQNQGPPPTINSVTSTGTALLVQWENDPYGTSSDASLLYIDTTSNQMYSILLNQDEIAAEEFYITASNYPGLVSGHNYACFFSLVASDGATHNSNTVSATFLTVPDAPTIISYVLDQVGYATVTIMVELQGTTSVTNMVFRILREGFSVSTQSFPAIDPSGNYVLTGLVLDADYIISAQSQNSLGYSVVSNTIAFVNNRAPETPTLGTINSGNNASVNLPITGYNSTSQSGGQSATITGFNVYYSLGSGAEYSSFVPYTNITSQGYYSIVLPNFTGNNGTIINPENQGYTFRVAAVNAIGTSLLSNTSVAVPALSLQAENIVVTFTGDNTINATWTNNAASWNTTGITTVNFYGAGLGYINSQSFANNLIPTSASFTLPQGSQLVPGLLYGVTMNGPITIAGSQVTGYTVVPDNVYNNFWAAPVLTNKQFPATVSDNSAVYSTVPGPVTNISYTSAIESSTLGRLTFTWTAAAENGAAIIEYISQLYTVSGGVRTPYGNIVQSNVTDVAFVNLPRFNGANPMQYAIGITARNINGVGPTVFYPSNPNNGIIITDAVNPVTNAVAIQTSYTSSQFLGTLSWSYNGPGDGYENPVFLVTQNGVPLTSGVPIYSAGTQNYSMNLNLGSTAGVEFIYSVVVRATVIISQLTTSSSPVVVSVRTGVAPIISNVSVTDNQGTWRLSFKVTNVSDGAMIANSILSIVMPHPLELITPPDSVNPVNNNYIVGLVPLNSPTGYTYTYDLPYQAIANDYLTITAANIYGAAAFNRWGILSPL